METLTSVPPEAPPKSPSKPPQSPSKPPQSPASSPPLFVGGAAHASVGSGPPSSKFTSVVPREQRLMQGLADTLKSWGATPRTLAIAGVFSVIAGALLIPVGGLVRTGVGTAGLLLAALGIQLRPFLDRLAHRMPGDASKRPALYGGVPDLVADATVVVAAGYAVSAVAAGPIIGWSAAVVGLLLAYVDMLGPCRWSVHPSVELAAPKQRMLAVTAVCLVCAVLPYGWRQPILLLVLAVVAGGCATALWARVSKR